jgi:hypothetical protein
VAFGVFTDIRQQDGAMIRMHYRDPSTSTILAVRWIGVMEQMADKYRQPDRREGDL